MKNKPDRKQKEKRSKKNRNSSRPQDKTSSKPKLEKIWTENIVGQSTHSAANKSSTQISSCKVVHFVSVVLTRWIQKHYCDLIDFRTLEVQSWPKLWKLYGTLLQNALPQPSIVFHMETNVLWTKSYLHPLPWCKGKGGGGGSEYCRNST